MKGHNNRFIKSPRKTTLDVAKLHQCNINLLMATFKKLKRIAAMRRLVHWPLVYIWYSEEGPGGAAAPPSPPIATPNVTAHPSTVSVPISYYSMWHYNYIRTIGLKVKRSPHRTSSNMPHWTYRITPSLILTLTLT